jgi:hypothetical protein
VPDAPTFPIIRLPYATGHSSHTLSLSRIACCVRVRARVHFTPCVVC